LKGGAPPHYIKYVTLYKVYQYKVNNDENKGSLWRLKPNFLIKHSKINNKIRIFIEDNNTKINLIVYDENNPDKYGSYPDILIDFSKIPKYFRAVDRGEGERDLTRIIRNLIIRE
jgi:hypothetical protein